jgi:hypothetical protein
MFIAVRTCLLLFWFLPFCLFCHWRVGRVGRRGLLTVSLAGATKGPEAALSLQREREVAREESCKGAIHPDDLIQHKEACQLKEQKREEGELLQFRSSSVRKVSSFCEEGASERRRKASSC